MQVGHVSEELRVVGGKVFFAFPQGDELAVGRTSRVWVSKRGFHVGDEGGDGVKAVSRIGVNKWYDLIKGSSLQTADRVDNLCCLIAEPIMVDFELYSELGNESGDFGSGAIESSGESFGPKGGDSGWWSSSKNWDRNIGGGGGVVKQGSSIVFVLLVKQLDFVR
ncbi:uncharacterized protein H6S33_006950 [Morchella sextelata]|uniref:uncharacterized protein n=1 Tax=Morchella sextelata TaxID=1174677 RepID=UPI001D03BC2B|nr:uncharacterized protein H6S33_006950 [Morchella sextelata]KAH0604573.1 hypothetical protein H6S33_006950 [Morchella sextelata]